MPTILVADSSRLMQRNLTMTLQQAGYDLLLASDGMEALTLCTRQPPDLMIADVGLPGKSGLELCQILRGNEATQHLPVLLLSTDERHKRYSPAYGAQGALLKPIETKELLSMAHSLLAPLPTPGQRLRIQLGDDPIELEVGGVTPPKQISLLVPPGTAFKSRQNFKVHYDGEGGARIVRTASVAVIADDSVTLSLGSDVSIEQRRRHFRKQVEIPVRYKLPGDFYRLGRTLDISGGGMRFAATGCQPPIGLEIDFQLVLDPSIFITVTGAVRRLAPAGNGVFEIGVEFLAIDPSVQQELTMFLFASAELGAKA
ncbi:MAG TPA: response regulator [Pantanalinema sp.]